MLHKQVSLHTQALRWLWQGSKAGLHDAQGYSGKTKQFPILGHHQFWLHQFLTSVGNLLFQITVLLLPVPFPGKHPQQSAQQHCRFCKPEKALCPSWQCSEMLQWTSRALRLHHWHKTYTVLFPNMLWSNTCQLNQYSGVFLLKHYFALSLICTIQLFHITFPALSMN